MDNNFWDQAYNPRPLNELIAEAAEAEAGVDQAIAEIEAEMNEYEHDGERIRQRVEQIRAAADRRQVQQNDAMQAHNDEFEQELNIGQHWDPDELAGDEQVNFDFNQLLINPFEDTIIGEESGFLEENLDDIIHDFEREFGIGRDINFNDEDEIPIPFDHPFGDDDHINLNPLDDIFVGEESGFLDPEIVDEVSFNDHALDDLFEEF